jgi:two-component system, OmpR family, sensor histidine kinase CiaH
MTSHPGDVRRSSIRVALSASAIVTAAYLAIAMGVFFIASASLTSQIDQQLTFALDRAYNQPIPPSGGNLGAIAHQPDRAFDAPFVQWIVKADGTVSSGGGPSGGGTALPAAYRSLSGSATATINGNEFRLLGAASDGQQYIVGQSLRSVSDAQSTIIQAEILIGPILIALVFLGAVAVGRRVATPIETARRRQLEFTADASHELRTPLSVVEAHTSLALAQDRSAEWYKSAFGRVDRESKRMRKLLDDLLWLARFDATDAAPNAEPVDLGILATQATDRFGVVAESRHLRLGVRAEGGGLVVAAPPAWLDRLMGVLIDNACKYSPDGGTVDVAVTGEAGRVTLTVDDAGPGIPEAERAQIFDRFHRATATGTGAGLGLAIGDEIVRATGGRWKVGSSPAGGARLQVSWRSALAGASARETSKAPGAVPGGGA